MLIEEMKASKISKRKDVKVIVVSHSKLDWPATVCFEAIQMITISL